MIHSSGRDSRLRKYFLSPLPTPESNTALSLSKNSDIWNSDRIEWKVALRVQEIAVEWFRFRFYCCVNFPFLFSHHTLCLKRCSHVELQDLWRMLYHLGQKGSFLVGVYSGTPRGFLTFILRPEILKNIVFLARCDSPKSAAVST